MALKKLMIGAALGTGAALVTRQRYRSRHYESPAHDIHEIDDDIDEFEAEHTHEHDDHTHITDPEKKSAFRRLKLPVIIGNVAIGAAEMITGGGNALAVTMDGVHNVGDAASYAAQFEADESSDRRKTQRLRKFGHWVIASSSALVGSKAVYDIATQADHSAHPASMVAATASLVFNGYLARGIVPIVKQRGWKNLGGAQRDIVKHFALVDAPSSVLAVGGAVAAHAGAHHASSTAAIVSGTIGAYVFRPTKKNLEEPHVCASHSDHQHGMHDHSGHDTKPARSERTPRLRRATALLGASAALLAGVTIAGAPSSHAPEATPTKHAPAPSFVDVDVTENIESPQVTEQHPKPSVYTVSAGDSLWKIADEELCEDECSNQKIANYVVDITRMNKLADPDYIVPTQRLVLPRV